MDWFQEGTFAKWPWERPGWNGKPPAIVSTGGFDINYERVAAQRPDLILGVYQDINAGAYKKLSRIAPTIAQDPKHDPYTTPWRDETRTIAKAVGRSAEAEKLIKDIDARFAKVRAEHPEFKGKKAVMLDPGTGKVFAFTSVDPRGQFLQELGFDYATAIDKVSKDGYGADISDERLDLIDVDYVFALLDRKNLGKLRDKAVFKRLVAFNNVLSIPYAIDGTLKQIAAAKKPG